MCAAKSIFQAPAVRTPSVKYLRETAAKFGFDLTDEELKEYQGFMADGLADYNVLDKYAEPIPEVKYPRLPGYRPPPEENKYNAWYYKTDIKGASSGLLSGKKVAIKDNVAVAGVPMMNGSKLLEGYIPEFDATVVSRILDAGGHILGKSACEHLCLSGSSFTNAKGPILNPNDTTRSAGGSSGGSAALVAIGEVDMAIGGDQGGSVRLPACWNGVVGLKPTYGLVPYTGAMSIEPAVDHLGPITKTVHDCALMLEAIAGYDDGLDARQPPNINVPKYTEALTGNLNGMKIGIVTEGFEETESDVESTVREAALKLKSLGAVVEEVSIPIHKDGPAIWGPICLEGGYQTIIENKGLQFGLKGFHPTSMVDHFATALKSRPNDLSVAMKYTCLFGNFIKESYNNHFYMKGANVNRTLTKEYNKVLDKYDVLVMPTIRFKAPKLPGPDVSIKEYLTATFNMIANTCGFDATGHPALSINAGYSSDKLPIGMMVVGKHWNESTILKVAHAYESIRDAKG